MVIGAGGATLADAHTVMEMAAAGLIRGCVEAAYPLGQVGEAFARLAEGKRSGQQTRPRSLTWAFVMERVTRIELAL
ncbi:hypothetical protein ACFXKG_23595 [Streptomyces sp. NPDC059255]|uniref:hypothetical protein n=1 Tax=Streptomyces sp. NPDC059255 TaxID=3346793 RepID=UPI00368CE276